MKVANFEALLILNNLIKFFKMKGNLVNLQKGLQNVFFDNTKLRDFIYKKLGSITPRISIN
jgi:hypothetical protein